MRGTKHSYIILVREPLTMLSLLRIGGGWNCSEFCFVVDFDTGCAEPSGPVDGELGKYLAEN
jgi:hypothetical protein